jgi:hypothetical protein
VVRLKTLVKVSVSLFGYLWLLGAVMTLIGSLAMLGTGALSSPPQMGGLEWIPVGIFVLSLGFMGFMGVLGVYYGNRLAYKPSGRNIKGASAMLAFFIAGPAMIALRKLFPFPWDAGQPPFILMATVIGIAIYALLACRLLRQHGCPVASPVSLVGRKLVLLVSLEVCIYSIGWIGMCDQMVPGLENVSDGWVSAFVYSSAVMLSIAFYFIMMRALARFWEEEVEAQPIDAFREAKE